MSTDLRDEIKQTRPFGSAEQEAHLGIERTAAILGHAFADAIRGFGITPTQYNVLRILRGAGPNGLCRNEVRDRLVSPVPDVTRLLDRMEEAGLIVRERGTEDRRLVGTRITKSGTDLLARMDGPVMEAHRRLLGHMSADQLETLARLLSIARKAV